MQQEERGTKDRGAFRFDGRRAGRYGALRGEHTSHYQIHHVARYAHPPDRGHPFDAHMELFRFHVASETDAGRSEHSLAGRILRPGNPRPPRSVDGRYGGPLQRAVRVQLRAELQHDPGVHLLRFPHARIPRRLRQDVPERGTEEVPADPRGPHHQAPPAERRADAERRVTSREARSTGKRRLSLSCRQNSERLRKHP